MPKDSENSLTNVLLPGDGEERIARILESITDGFYGFDEAWRFVFLNEAAKRMLAPYVANPEGLMGKNYWEEFPATLNTDIHDHFHRAVREQMSVEFEVYYAPWDRWYSVRCFPIRGGGLSVYFQDFTETKLASDALKLSEAKYRSVLSSVDEGFCVIEILRDTMGVAVDYRFVEVNPAFKVQSGLVDPVGRTASEVQPGIERHWSEIYGRVASSGEPSRFVEGSDVMGRWFDVYAFPVVGGEGQRVGVLFTDITRRRENDEALKLAKDQAESGSRAKDDFLATLSHELRTPLTPVLMLADELCEREDVQEDVKVALVTIRRNISLEARLIDDLLDLTKISNGKLSLREQECEVQSLMGLAIEIVREDALAKEVDLRVELAPEGTTFRGDPARIQQVYWNLLKNAVKFTPTGGSVTVRSRRAGDHVVVEISDTGMGIAPEVLPDIFKPFEQGPGVTSHRFGGLGLGLSIAKAIVDLHGGTISAHSAGLNRGATFRVTLVAAEVSPEPKIDLGGRVTSPAASVGLRLLLVEDHEPTMKVLSRLLQKSGHQVVPAGTVTDAKQLAEQHEFDGVISDIGLPDGSGLELMKHLNTRCGLRGIALSGYGTEEDMQRSREVGFMMHLVKPFPFDQLRQAISSFPQAASSKAEGNPGPA